MFSKRDILKLIIPMIIQNILTIMVGTFDSIMVSSAGEAAVSGVSLVGTPISCGQNFFSHNML